MNAPEALREFLMYVVANLIEHPKQASIAVGTTQSGAVSFRIQLAPDDVRRVVGRNGFTISAIRSLVNVAAHKHGVRVVLRVDGVSDEDEAEHMGEGGGEGQPQPSEARQPAEGSTEGQSEAKQMDTNSHE
ncbi:KH domain-containing protein [Phragmitibacter flavus]|uniref:KH domain-containing protein n=1 Tax=Phragmitibacter flavus TaxID=2576071 RepID=A0A5R8KEZ6_9BACT|nr:KH domain-containing protein [Phragmitibacter flavus]TLD70862.1 KH domain-containing protein [Phragmitibacter flavus]